LGLRLARVAPRGQEHLATLRVKDRNCEIRKAEFEELETPVEVRPEEVAMAEMLVASVTRPFNAAEHVDRSRERIEELTGMEHNGEEISPWIGLQAAKDARGMTHGA
jgi:DNA end-binding protein Ku